VELVAPARGLAPVAESLAAIRGYIRDFDFAMIVRVRERCAVARVIAT
jgi:hypothetical protein